MKVQRTRILILITGISYTIKEKGPALNGTFNNKCLI
jgi:hypothetical protein